MMKIGSALCGMLIAFFMILVVLMSILIGLGFAEKSTPDSTRTIQCASDSTYTIQLASIDSQDEGDCFILGTVLQQVDTKDYQYYVVNKILEDGSERNFKMLSDVTTINAILDEDAQAYAEVTENQYEEVITAQLYVPRNYKRRALGFTS